MIGARAQRTPKEREDGDVETFPIVRTQVERDQVFGSIMFILKRDQELADRVAFELRAVADDEREVGAIVVW